MNEKTIKVPEGWDFVLSLWYSPTTNDKHYQIDVRSDYYPAHRELAARLIEVITDYDEEVRANQEGTG